MKRSSSGEIYAADMSFKDAAAIVCKAWRKRHGYRIPPPSLSHALSVYEDGVWQILDADLGERVAIVSMVWRWVKILKRLDSHPAASRGLASGNQIRRGLFSRDRDLEGESQLADHDLNHRL